MFEKEKIHWSSQTFRTEVQPPSGEVMTTKNTVIASPSEVEGEAIQKSEGLVREKRYFIKKTPDSCESGV
jgi:hypothetical protein